MGEGEQQQLLEVHHREGGEGEEARRLGEEVEEVVVAYCERRLCGREREKVEGLKGEDEEDVGCECE